MKEIKDSGSRREFSTGAVRDMSNADKGDFSLLPWEVIWDLAKHYSRGLEKYGRDNWRKGIPVDSYFDSAIRHLMKHHLGHDDEDHAIACLWNVACMIWEERYSPRARTKKLVEEIEELSNSVIEEINDEVEEKNDGIKHVHINQLREPFGYCDECHISSKLYAHPSGKKLCAKCWNKEEDDLK